jgi:ketosteroid isomerase-like protein
MKLMTRRSRNHIRYISIAITAGAAFSLNACRMAPVTQSVPSMAPDSVGAHRAASAFIAAFDSLQWVPFTSYLADDITMFFPFGDTPRRADGRAAVEARFKPFFDRGAAALAQGGRKSQGLQAREWMVQAFNGGAVVSFHLGTDRPSRRSLVFRKTDAGEWKLVHWHASPAPPSPSGG